MTVWMPSLPVLKAMGCTEQYLLWELLTDTTNTEQGETP